MFNPSSNLNHAISRYPEYCEGYGRSNNSNYILGSVLGIGTVPSRFSHTGSDTLDQINAFDKAEISDTNIGQINLITVSSFCGPQGLVWGYDLARPTNLRKQHPLLPSHVTHKRIKVPVYNIEPLLQATKSLFGTVSEPRFPLLPGSHVPCASKWETRQGPTHIYVAVALGIPQDRNRAACLLMEDHGTLPHTKNADLIGLRSHILTQSAKSIIAIGSNQHVKYKEIFVGIKDTFVKPSEYGCALLAMPYFLLAQKAIPFDNPKTMLNSSLKNWEKHILL